MLFFTKNKRLSCHNESGSVLIMTLVVSFLLVVFSAGMLSLLSTDARGTLQTIRSNSALNVAEAGVEETLWELNYGGGDFDAGSGWSGDNNQKTKTAALQTNNSETVGEYSITVTDPGGDYPKIQVTGYIPEKANALAQRAVQIFTESEEEPDFNMAAFGTASVTFDKEVITDSYNSTKGPYGPENKDGSMGHVATDSIAAKAITLGKEVEINGNVIIGPNGIPEEVIFKPDEVEVSPVVSPQPFNPQPKATPTGLPLRPNINLGKDSTVTISANGQYDTISLGKESTLIIDAATDVTIYVTDTFSLAKESELRVVSNSGAKVKIYFGNATVSIDKEGILNNSTQNPTLFGFYGTADFTGTIDINKETDFYGVVHVPNGIIDIDKQTEIYGALVANQITMDKESSIHFDEALLEAGGGAKTYAMTYWQEK